MSSLAYLSSYFSSEQGYESPALSWLRLCVTQILVAKNNSGLLDELKFQRISRNAYTQYNTAVWRERQVENYPTALNRQITKPK